MNNHATMRLAKTDPLQLTHAERHFDAIQRFENRDRYALQSANTRDGAPGSLPMRQPLTRGERYASQQSAPDHPVMQYADRRGV